MRVGLYESVFLGARLVSLVMCWCFGIGWFCCVEVGWRKKR